MVEGAITIERKEKRSKELIPKIKQRRLKAIILQGTIDKNTLFVRIFGAPMIISLTVDRDIK